MPSSPNIKLMDPRAGSSCGGAIASSRGYSKHEGQLKRELHTQSVLSFPLEGVAHR
jgi:hypothetical protein